MDYFQVYKALKEKAKTTDENHLIKTPMYQTLANLYPHRAKVILLEARMRELKTSKSEAARFADKQRFDRDLARTRRALKRELLLQRSRYDYVQWRSREAKEFPRVFLHGVKSIVVLRPLKAIRRMGGRVVKSLPLSIRYPSSLAFTSEDIVKWSRGYLKKKKENF